MEGGKPFALAPIRSLFPLTCLAAMGGKLDGDTRRVPAIQHGRTESERLATQGRGSGISTGGVHSVVNISMLRFLPYRRHCPTVYLAYYTTTVAIAFSGPVV